MTTRNLAAWERDPASDKLSANFKASNYIRIVGTGFGVKPSGFRFAQDFSDVANLADVPASGNAGGTGLKLAQGGGSSIDSTNPHSGVRCWHTLFTENQQTPRLSLTLDNQYRKIMFSCWWRFRVNSFTGGAADWKLGRIGNTTEPYTSSRFDHEYTGIGTPTTNSTNTSVTTGSGVNSFNPEYWAASTKTRAGHTAFLPVQNTWYLYQMIGDSGDLNTSNSYFEVFLNGTSLGYFDGSFNTDPLKTFRNADHPDMLRSLLLPVTGIVNSTNNIDVWVDEVVVSDGWKSAVMTDSPTYGQTLGAGKCVQLLDHYWADDEIYFLNNIGVFNSGETAYIHLLDDTYSKFKTVSVTIP